MLYQQEEAVIVGKIGGLVLRHVPCLLYVSAALPSAQGELFHDSVGEGPLGAAEGDFLRSPDCPLWYGTWWQCSVLHMVCCGCCWCIDLQVLFALPKDDLLEVRDEIKGYQELESRVTPLNAEYWGCLLTLADHELEAQR
jgi:hypothetical protein